MYHTTRCASGRPFHVLDLHAKTSLESALHRSMRYSDIIGQEDSIARLRAFSDFYRNHGSTTEHILIVADEGMGKRAIAGALAEEFGVPCQEVDASGLEILGDLTAILTNLRQNEILIVHDVHRLRRVVQDVLLGALRTHKLTITLGQGPSARRHVLDLKPFTIVGIAPKKSDCSEELLSCFALVLPLQAYSNEALEKIGEKIAAQEKIEIDAAAMRLLAANSRSRPDKLKMLVQRVARAVNKPRITEEDTLQSFAVFGMAVPTGTHTGNPAGLKRMSGVEFERFVPALLARMEFRPEMRSFQPTTKNVVFSATFSKLDGAAFQFSWSVPALFGGFKTSPSRRRRRRHSSQSVVQLPARRGFWKKAVACPNAHDVCQKTRSRGTSN